MSLTGPLRRLIFKNWLAKLICLLLAVGLWFWVAVQQTDRRTFETRVDFVDIPGGYVVGEKTEREVKITVSGPRTILANLDRDDIDVARSLSDLEVNGSEEVLRLFPWDVSVPRGVEVTDISPGNVHVYLEPRTQKTVPVSVDISGETVPGYEYRSRVEPETAVVAGPSGRIDDLERLRVTGVQWPSPEQETRRTVKEADLDSNLILEFPDENKFRVELAVYQPQVVRELTGVPVKIVDVPEQHNAAVSPDSVSVDVRGPQQLVESLSPSDLRAVVEAPQEAGESIGNVRLELPDGVELAEDSERYIQVKITVEEN